MGSDAGTAANFINAFIHFLGYWLYQPVYHLYDLLPFSESITQWRGEFTDAYFSAYLKPMFIGFCINVAVEATFGAAFGSLFNLIGDFAAIIHFFDNIGVGIVHVAKGILGLPVYLVCLFGPYILPPIITIGILVKIIGAISGLFSSKTQ